MVRSFPFWVFHLGIFSIGYIFCFVSYGQIDYDTRVIDGTYYTHLYSEQVYLSIDSFFRSQWVEYCLDHLEFQFQQDFFILEYLIKSNVVNHMEAVLFSDELGITIPHKLCHDNYGHYIDSIHIEDVHLSLE